MHTQPIRACNQNICLYILHIYAIPILYSICSACSQTSTINTILSFLANKSVQQVHTISSARVAHMRSADISALGLSDKIFVCHLICVYLRAVWMRVLHHQHPAPRAITIVEAYCERWLRAPAFRAQCEIWTYIILYTVSGTRTLMVRSDILVYIQWKPCDRIISLFQFCAAVTVPDNPHFVAIAASPSFARVYELLVGIFCLHAFAGAGGAGVVARRLSKTCNVRECTAVERCARLCGMRPRERARACNAWTRTRPSLVHTQMHAHASTHANAKRAPIALRIINL